MELRPNEVCLAVEVAAVLDLNRSLGEFDGRSWSYEGPPQSLSSLDLVQAHLLVGEYRLGLMLHAWSVLLDIPVAEGVVLFSERSLVVRGHAFFTSEAVGGKVVSMVPNGFHDGDGSEAEPEAAEGAGEHDPRHWGNEVSVAANELALPVGTLSGGQGEFLSQDLSKFNKNEY